MRRAGAASVHTKCNVPVRAGCEHITFRILLSLLNTFNGTEYIFNGSAWIWFEAFNLFPCILSYRGLLAISKNQSESPRFSNLFATPSFSKTMKVPTLHNSVHTVAIASAWKQIDLFVTNTDISLWFDSEHALTERLYGETDDDVLPLRIVGMEANVVLPIAVA